jgi:integrase
MVVDFFLSLEESTISGMKIHQRQLERHFGKTFLIQSLSLSKLQEYVQKRSKDEGLHGRKVTPTTIKKAIVTLRTIWNWGRHHGLLGKTLSFPSKGLQYPKGTAKPLFMTFAEVERRVRKLNPAESAELWECVFLSLSEIDELLGLVEERARHPFIYPMFVLAAHTGARRSEIMRSKLYDLDFDANMVTIHERKKSHDKRTTRRVPMSNLLRETMLSWLGEHPGGEYTFCQPADMPRSRRRSTEVVPLTRDEAHDHFKRTLAGTKWEKLRGWHAFRHSFCSNCAAKGIDQRIIDEWVGHLSEEMVRRYRHLLPDQQRRAIDTVFGSADAIMLRSSA